ncbi:hypothetical protein T01_2491 [Trichinella spiralis]|uniref:Uncharacterized protein n=1 Tax=Trichinella spiralis TaxID=6334 RepID=A0A0V1AYB8_TRISP|nr:hypothetical protein T01_2491 [Trichinella spiralis]
MELFCSDSISLGVFQWSFIRSTELKTFSGKLIAEGTLKNQNTATYQLTLTDGVDALFQERYPAVPRQISSAMQ